MTFQLFTCHRMSASISREQCATNRGRKHISCTGCPGLPAEAAGEVVLAVPPQEEEAAAVVPTVVLKFEEPGDLELYNVLKGICSDLEYDIISLLHLACRADVKTLARLAKTEPEKSVESGKKARAATGRRA